MYKLDSKEKIKEYIQARKESSLAQEEGSGGFRYRKFTRFIELITSTLNLDSILVSHEVSDRFQKSGEIEIPGVGRMMLIRMAANLYAVRLFAIIIDKFGKSSHSFMTDDVDRAGNTDTQDFNFQIFIDDKANICKAIRKIEKRQAALYTFLRREYPERY